MIFRQANKSVLRTQIHEIAVYIKRKRFVAILYEKS